ncbi:MAG: DNA polymerase II large subunit [Nanoarchaeota archaeon]|nr:DNA polymerase II large subunit [Nanoarchaeota archaeon]
MSVENYLKNLREEVDKIYSLSTEARKKGLDPVDEVEIPLAMSMAEKVVGLISTIYPQMKDSGIAKRILDLENEYGKLDPTVVFKIAEEVAKQNFCKFEDTLQAIDAGIRVGFAYITLGVVSSPIEGFTGLKIRKTKEGKDYLEASFSGPIRSAGTTASCLVLMLIDYLRELFGFAKYDPTEDEIKRVYAELEHFHDRITNLQYMPTEEEGLFLAKHLPIQIAGDASEKLEVPNYKNLERVDTDYLRSGVCLVLGEGLAQKAAKGFRLLNRAKSNGIKSTGFDWIKDYVELHEKRDKGKTDDSPTYIKDLVAGRPVFGHPGRSGGFRFRYGRGRNSGFSAAAVHPATMAITDGFIAIGTQLKIEKPTKGCATTSCDSIEGPIVKLKSGSVRKVFSKEEAKEVYPFVEEIIYLGDLLFPFSDVVNRNAMLIKPGYVEEWWNLELKNKGGFLSENNSVFDLSLEESIQLSENFEIPLHPKHIFYWTQINKTQFMNLLSWLKSSIFQEKLIFPFSIKDKEKFLDGKRALELLGIPHEVTIENVVIDKENSLALLVNLGFNLNELKDTFELRTKFVKLEKSFDEEDVLKIINSLSIYEIKDKAGSFIGSRMGRPEKAKVRKLTGSPNSLFPVGSEGGRLRSIQAACDAGYIKNSFPLRFCEFCNKDVLFSTCEFCGKKTQQKYYFSDIKETFLEKKIKISDVEGRSYVYKSIDINEYVKIVNKKLGLDGNTFPPLVKGVRGLSSEEKIPENLIKGVLRAKYNLQVNKDGTIRMDATELPVTHFKPKEIRTSIEKLKSLGYEKDIQGNELKNEDQILELMPHDVLIPSSKDNPEEKGEETFIKICNFVDDLLEKMYDLPPYYNIKTKEDLAGVLGVCMAPHNCAGVVCRFIGFSNTLSLMASPYMHAAIRRDCDGDEAAIMLLGDVLLNFSRKFLPSHRGGTQDAPLVLNAKIDAGEVDDQILDFEMVKEYPLQLYQLAEQKKHSSEAKIYLVRDALKDGKNPFVNIGFTHDTTDFNEGVHCSSYKLLGQMQEKVDHQMKLVEKLRSVDTSDTARLIIERHFMRDMRGNLRSFSMQSFRCVKCNEIYRRPPLSGVCLACGGKLIFTINEGGIKKYLEPALNLAKKYNLSVYLRQNLDLVKGYIDSIFGKEKEKQAGLQEWF